jgi:hypothetical protein
MKGIIQTINVTATLKSMEIGANIFLGAQVNENTLRNACVRLKNVVGGAWTVDKIGKKGFKVTRTA